MNNMRTEMNTNIRMVSMMALAVVLLGAVTGTPYPRKCPLSKYTSLFPSVIKSAKELQTEYETSTDLTRSRKNMRCSMGLLLKKFPECNLQGNERLRLTLSRVSLAVSVLMNISKLKSSDLVQQNTETFAVLKEDLNSCVSPLKHSILNPQKLESCHGHLVKYSRNVSPECLQDDVMLNLVWLLTEDLSFLVHGNLHQGASPLLHTASPPRKHKKGRKNKKHKKHKHKSLAKLH
ncbi:interferon lambda-3-like [Discoglossus pictus]